eukprot:9489665-Pyramimonas_sp.AAC.1
MVFWHDPASSNGCLQTGHLPKWGRTLVGPMKRELRGRVSSKIVDEYSVYTSPSPPPPPQAGGGTCTLARGKYHDAPQAGR